MYEEYCLKYVRFHEDFTNRWLDVTTESLKQRNRMMDFVFLHVLFFPFFTPFPFLLHPYGCIPSSCFLHFSFKLPLSISSSCLGICLLVWHLSSLVEDKFNIHIKTLWLCFSASLFQIHHSSFTSRSDLSFIIIVIHLTWTFPITGCFPDLCLIDFFPYERHKISTASLFSQMPHTLSCYFFFSGHCKRL